MSRSEVEAKALDLMGSSLGLRRANAVVQAVADIESLATVGELVALLAP